MGSSSRPRRAGPGSRDPGAQERVAPKELCVGFPCEGPSPRPSIQPLLPDTPDAAVELPQAAVVRRSAVVLVVAAKFRIEDGLLLAQVVVPMSLAPFGDAVKRASQALSHRSEANRELPSPAARTYVRKAKKVEGLGFRPRLLCSMQSLTPEWYEACLFRVES